MLLAHLADRVVVDGSVREVTLTSVVELLKIVAASMLAIATFAVASMVSAYASAGQTATARAFPLVVADVSQNALPSRTGPCRRIRRSPLAPTPRRRSASMQASGRRPPAIWYSVSCFFDPVRQRDGNELYQILWDGCLGRYAAEQS